MTDEPKEAYPPTMASEGLVGGQNLARMRRVWVDHIWHLLDAIEPLVDHIDGEIADAIETAKTYCQRGLASQPEAYAGEPVE